MDTLQEKKRDILGDVIIDRTTICTVTNPTTLISKSRISCYTVQKADTTQKYAVKEILIPEEFKSNNELEIFKILASPKSDNKIHDNIVGFIDSYFEENAHGIPIMHIVMEYVPENLNNKLDQFYKSSNAFTIPAKFEIASGILMGIQWIHSFNYIHCDIKPDNILIQENTDSFVAKLCDFGLSITVNEPQTKSFGTPLYWSNAVIHSGNTQQADLFAAGFCLLMLIKGVSENSFFDDIQSMFDLKARNSRMDTYLYNKCKAISEAEAPIREVIRQCFKNFATDKIFREMSDAKNRFFSSRSSNQSQRETVTLTPHQP